MYNLTRVSMAAALALAAVLPLCGGTVAAQEPDACAGGVLSPQASGTDLVVKSPCTVNAGTYKFKDVHILANGVLTFDDAAIDFWAANILVENDGSLVAGSPDAPIGTKGGALTIHLWGQDQSGVDPAKEGQGVVCLSDVNGHCGVPDAIWNSNADAMGMPVPPASARKISALGAVAAQYPRADDDPKEPGYVDVKNDYFYAYDTLTFDGAKDVAGHVGYFGYKVLAVSYGGTLKLFGKKGATYAAPECGVAPSSSGSSWARLDKSAAVGETKLTVDRKLSLKAGDQIVVTTTDYMPGHSEQLEVASDVVCEKTIAFTNGLKYAHNGTRFSLASVPLRIGLDAQLKAQGAETRAAVGVLTRSIRIVSAGDTMNDEFPAQPEKDSRAPGYYFGGHMIARQGFKRFQVQGVELRQMGQGGKIGHYPVHFHHTRKAPADTFVRDSSINESMTRWIVLHGAQYVHLERNVGWKSIGHGFYLEDGTETDNTLTANLGVFARAAVDNDQNPRKVPGILAASNLFTQVNAEIPYTSDYDYPSVFWIMNSWNDFKDNMAVGAGTCGVCYWLVPAVNSGMSRSMKWMSYASMQTRFPDRAGMAPLKSFVGNMCSAAMTSFQTVGKTEACQGVGPGGETNPDKLRLDLLPINNPLAPPTVAPPGSDAPTVAAVEKAKGDYYASVDQGGGHFSTRCDAEDCSVIPARCSDGSAAACMVTILDHYTTSFNWAALNFAAIWLRPQWYLVTDSVITDAQQAGLTIVTGGGYTSSDVIPGHWALVRKSVFIGNTQDTDAPGGNPFASNGGPFNPQSGVRCAADKDGNRPTSFCLSKDEGVSHQMGSFGMYQRMFSVYDGPAFQESNAYLNITKRRIDDCIPFVDGPNKSGRCDPSNITPGGARQSAWLAGLVLGLPKVVDPGSTQPYCYMPNAAIGWKQPNGFYYPPAFHSKNLFFDNVDIRHFVVTPQVLPGGNETDFAKVSQQICVYNSAIYDGFAGNDRQTVLNDDDGTLTGYRDTTVINKDAFFAAPIDATQCRSDNSSRTSPYKYVSTVIYPKCAADGTCARPPALNNPNWNDGDWNRSCTSETCYGVPLWRQDLMPIADNGQPTSMRMMGQATGQRGSLTVNNGTYYMDTTVSKERQLKGDTPASKDLCGKRDNPNPCVINVFKANQTYYLFLLYAKPDTRQTYRFYVGDTTDFDPSGIRMVQASIGAVPIRYTDLGGLPMGRAHWLNNDKATAKGVVEVSLVLQDLPSVTSLFQKEKKASCQPATYCKWSGSDATGQCMGVDGTQTSNDSCKWAGADPDCPANGCFGIAFTLPSGFETQADFNPPPDPRPAATCVQNAAPWAIPFDNVSDGTCPDPKDDEPLDFCAK